MSGGYGGGGGGRHPYLNMNTLSLGLRKGEPGTFHHVCDMKDRHKVDTTSLYMGMHKSVPMYMHLRACDCRKFMCS